MDEWAPWGILEEMGYFSMVESAYNRMFCDYRHQAWRFDTRQTKLQHLAPADFDPDEYAVSVAMAVERFVHDERAKRDAKRDAKRVTKHIADHVAHLPASLPGCCVGAGWLCIPTFGDRHVHTAGDGA